MPSAPVPTLSNTRSGEEDTDHVWKAGRRSERCGGACMCGESFDHHVRPRCHPRHHRRRGNPTDFVFTPDRNRPIVNPQWTHSQNLRLTWQASPNHKLAFYRFTNNDSVLNLLNGVPVAVP